MRHTLLMLSTALLLVAVPASVTLGAVPPVISYQGYLADSLGIPLDTTLEMTFTIYEDESGFTQLWTETHGSVHLNDGLFFVLLGSITPLDIGTLDGSTRYLGIQLGAGPSSDSLLPMVSVAYSFRAITADTAEYAVSGAGGNSALGQSSTVGGGLKNTADGYRSIVSGGHMNYVSGQYSTIGGGVQDTIIAKSAVVAGGNNNKVWANRGTIGGGASNEISAEHATIPGGFDNTIGPNGEYSYLFGIRSDLDEDSTFMVDMPHIRFSDTANGYEFPHPTVRPGTLW